jgi:molybdate transport system regulatory protein
MELSARNQIKGRIISIKHGAVMAEVVIEVDSQEITSTITMGSLGRLQLAVGDRVTAIFKASDVLIGK